MDCGDRHEERRQAAHQQPKKQSTSVFVCPTIECVKQTQAAAERITVVVVDVVSAFLDHELKRAAVVLTGDLLTAGTRLQPSRLQQRHDDDGDDNDNDDAACAHLMMRPTMVLMVKLTDADADASLPASLLYSPASLTQQNTMLCHDC